MGALDQVMGAPPLAGGAVDQVMAAPEPGPNPDQTGSYNTPLEPEKEAEFQKWMEVNPKAQGDMADYDVRGAWKAGKIPASGHGPDDWKKPNHPTFSDESIYHGPATPGGKWVQLEPESKAHPAGVWKFQASPYNLHYRDATALQDYFNRVEAGNTLALPSAK